MDNLYVVIIGLFALSGLVTGTWSWLKISKARRSENWIKTEGKVVKITAAVDMADLTPRVEYAYAVDGNTYQGVFSLDHSDVVLPEFATEYEGKYPLNSLLDVFYNPENNEESTPEPGVKKDDWFIFGLCVSTLVTGVLYIVFNV